MLGLQCCIWRNGRLDRFEALSTFIAVAETGGFARAARRIGASPPAVTRTVAGLERHLGVALFHRSTRSVALTPEGTALLDRARDVLAQLQEAEHLVMGRRTAPRGALHVTAPSVFGRLHVLPVLAALLEAHREVTVRLMLVDRNVRLVEEGIDVAVRVGALRDSGLAAVGIGSVRQVIVASPAYCAGRGRPERPRDLARHDVILGEGGRAGPLWRFGSPAARGVQVTPRLTVSSVDATIAAAVAGLGLANVLSYQVAALLDSGALCSVLDEHAPPPLPVHLLFQPGRARMPVVRLFVDEMRRRGTEGRWR